MRAFTHRLTATLAFATAVLFVAATVAACGGDDTANTGPGASATAKVENVTLRLGYFPNITHAQPLVGLERGTYAEELGANVKLETKTFNAGPAAIEALFAGAIDATYIGPNPAINGYVQSEGKDLRIVAGATSAGASLIVRADAGMSTPADFANKKVATPQLGNTQDVALRAWLQKNGLKDKDHGGNVQVIPTANADTLTLFQRGQIDAAWVPEPWGTRLIQEANGRLFLDERDLWPNGDFVTTQLIVRTKFLNEHPEVVEKLLLAHVKTTLWINDNPDEAKKLVNQGIKKVTNAAIPDAVINTAWRNQKVTYDPIASSLRKSADDAFALGYLGDKKPDLANIYSLDLLNKVLASLNLKAVQQ
ncbi:MAG TPA: ABC transporter substrate-binding protein [Dehalococcoidia bacterium]|nr:ABC transporter substrate-binding protein [Dehalococcoidia bacterium]